MPWIKQISIEEAKGLLKTQFDSALKRAGRVWHIVHIMSLNPRAMHDSIGFYATMALVHKSRNGHKSSICLDWLGNLV